MSSTTVVSDGARLHTVRAGSGPPLLLTHGLGSSAATWSSLLPRLPEGVSTIRWDLRGHGRSSRPADARAYTRDVALADLTAVAETATTAALLVGHSLGGYLSLALAITRPDLVRGLVLIAAGPGFGQPERRAAWNRMLVANAARLGVPAEVTGLCAQPDALVVDRLADIDAPVVAIVGSEDRHFHAAADVFARRLGADVHVVAAAGHHPHETRPAEVAALIGEFVDRLEPGPPRGRARQERTQAR